MVSRKRGACKNPKGFSQIASCKSRGLIPRTGKSNHGKYIKSKKQSRNQSRTHKLRHGSRK